MKRAIILALGLLASACGRTAGAPAPASAAHTLHSEQDVVTQSVLPLAELLEAEGFTLDPNIDRGFLAPASRVTREVTIAPHTCLAMAAVATPSIADLDAGLYAADGSVLAEDDASDARPVVRICTGQQPVTAYLALFAFQGTGSYAIARLTRPAKPSDEMLGSDEAVGSAPFLELVRGLRRRGYHDDGPTTDLPLVAGSALRIANKVAAGQCYTVVADGEQLRVRLLDEDGRELALGIGEQGPAAFQYCASRSAELTLEVSGQGAARAAHLLRLRASQTAVGGARAVWLGEPSVGGAESAPEASKHDSCAGTEQPIAAEARLTQGKVLELPLPAASSKCELIEATLHEGLSRVTLRVESAQGVVLGEREILRGSSGLYVCDAGQARRISALGRAGFGALTLVRHACAY